MVLTVQQTIETPQLLLNTLTDVPFAQVVQDIPVLTPRLVPMVSLTIEIPKFFIDKVIDVPVVQVVRVPLVSSWRRQSCSHVCTR